MGLLLFLDDGGRHRPPAEQAPPHRTDRATSRLLTRKPVPVPVPVRSSRTRRRRESAAEAGVRPENGGRAQRQAWSGMGAGSLGWQRVPPLRLRYQAAGPGSRRGPPLPALRQHLAVAAGTAVPAVHGVLRAGCPLGTTAARGLRHLRRRRRGLSTVAPAVDRRAEWAGPALGGIPRHWDTRGQAGAVKPRVARRASSPTSGTSVP